MFNPIKENYAEEIAEYVAKGGKISTAKNTGKVHFNQPSDDVLEKMASAKNEAKAINKDKQTRITAKNQGLTVYRTSTPCTRCYTSERSVRSNACLECDRMRKRKGNLNDQFKNIGEQLLRQNKEVRFSSGGKEYVLKVEIV